MDEEDGFYYDVLRLPDGSATRLKVRSLVGLLPLCATTVIEKEQRERVPNAMGYVQERLRRSPELLATMTPPVRGIRRGRTGAVGAGQPGAAPPDSRAEGSSSETSSWGPTGIRSISKPHEQHPYVFFVNGQE